jgi:hypothetical protein
MFRLQRFTYYVKRIFGLSNLNVKANWLSVVENGCLNPLRKRKTLEKAVVWTWLNLWENSSNSINLSQKFFASFGSDPKKQRYSWYYRSIKIDTTFLFSTWSWIHKRSAFIRKLFFFFFLHAYSVRWNVTQLTCILYNNGRYLGLSGIVTVTKNERTMETDENIMTNWWSVNGHHTIKIHQILFLFQFYFPSFIIQYT